MQRSILAGNSQAQPGASAVAHAGGIGTPKAVEHKVFFAFFQSDTVVQYDDRHRPIIASNSDIEGLPLGMVQCILNEIAENALDPSSINGHKQRLAGHMEANKDVEFLRQLDVQQPRIMQRAQQIDLLERQLFNAGIVTGNIQKVAEQPLETPQFFIHQRRGTTHHGVKVVGVIFDDVRSHPNRRQG